MVHDMQESVSTWEACDKCCAQCKVRNPLPQLVQQRDGVALRRTVHAQERHVGDVLQWDVDVLAHLHITTHNVTADVQTDITSSNFIKLAPSEAY